MKCDKNVMCLYAVTDRSWANEKTLYEQVEDALKGGVTCIQLREKELSHADFLTEAMQLKTLCQNYHVPFIINDNVEIAIACSADGVHVGQHDMAAENVRAKIGNEMILGVSVQTVLQAMQAQKMGADYLGVGAVFATQTKSDADSVSHDTLKAICLAVSIPVVAIGGIDKNNILKLKDTGIDGVALISAIFASKDIKLECRKLRKLSEQIIYSFDEKGDYID